MSEPMPAPSTPRGGKRKFDDDIPTPPPAPSGQRRVQTISMIRGGRKICKEWNDSRGCNKKNCDSIHGCDVRLPDGSACLSKSHNRMTHPSS